MTNDHICLKQLWWSSRYSRNKKDLELFSISIMGRSRKWPDLRSQRYNIRHIKLKALITTLCNPDSKNCLVKHCGHMIQPVLCSAFQTLDTPKPVIWFLIRYPALKLSDRVCYSIMSRDVCETFALQSARGNSFRLMHETLIAYSKVYLLSYHQHRHLDLWDVWLHYLTSKAGRYAISVLPLCSSPLAHSFHGSPVSGGGHLPFMVSCAS